MASQPRWRTSVSLPMHNATHAFAYSLAYAQAREIDAAYRRSFVDYMPDDATTIDARDMRDTYCDLIEAARVSAERAVGYRPEVQGVLRTEVEGALHGIPLQFRPHPKR